MTSTLSPKLLLALLWAILTFVSLWLRPLFPIDETRYAAVAWEMWQRGDFLVPHLNGETYSHKPPLLFWLMHLSWFIFGVNDWSLRVIAPLFSLASLYLLQPVAKQLWPERDQLAQLAPFILLGTFFWMVFGTLTMFDIMLSFFALLGMYAQLLLIRQGLSIQRWLLLGVAIGGGVLTKGPVILLHLLPMALLAPWLLASEINASNKKRWYLGVLCAVFTGAAIALCWAVPAGIAGGEVYRKAIFLGQTTGRVVDSFAHKLPFWWYLQMLPLLLLPWLLTKPCWAGIAKFNKNDFGLRFCLTWVLPVFIAFSLVSGKRIHYLLPLMPAVALLIAWSCCQVDAVVWRRSNSILMIIMGLLGLVFALLPSLNAVYPMKVDLTAVSPLWGVLLMLIVIVFLLRKSENATDSIISLCFTAIVAALMFSGGFFQAEGSRYDTKPPAQKIAALMAENRAVGFLGNKYHGQFHFSGRLTKPILLIPDQKALYNFVANNPTGYVLIEYKYLKDVPMAAVSYKFAFKSHYVGIIACQTLLSNPGMAAKLSFS